MLPAAHRLTRSEEFGTVVRRGRRTGRRTLVVHVVEAVQAVPANQSAGTADPGDRVADQAVRVGFVVSRAVGGSVVRNRVQRRLRAATAALVPALPAGTRVVVRALPAAADAGYHELDADLTGALRRIGLISS